MKSVILFFCIMVSPIFVTASAEQSQNISIDAKKTDPYEQLDVRDLLKKLFKKDSQDGEPEKEKRKKTSLFLIPIIGANPSIGTAFGGALSAVGYRESEEENVSTLLASLTYTSKSFLVFNTRSDLTLRKHWHLLGDWRYYDYRERTHGFGSGTSEDSYADIDYKWVRFREAVLLPLHEDLEVGVDYVLDMHLDIQPASSDESLNVIPAAGDTVSSGIGPAFIYDSTDNRINATRGLYISGRYRFYEEWMGSDDNWQLLDLEARSYHRFPSRRHQVLAIWGMSQVVTSGAAPYFDNPANAWDTYGRTTRGYTAGRFRGTGWLYGEVEYRTDLTKNGFVGAVAFVNTSSFRADDEGFGNWVVGGGIGFRFKVDKRTGSNITIDVGFGQEGSRGVYLAFNEAF